MSDCKQYKGIDRDELNKLRRRLAKEGINVPEGDDVEVEAPFGVHLTAKYEEGARLLEICITKKPMFVPKSQIWKIVDKGTAPYVD